MRAWRTAADGGRDDEARVRQAPPSSIADDDGDARTRAIATCDNGVFKKDDVAAGGDRAAHDHGRAAGCWHPQVRNLTLHINSICNNWRFEDV